MSADFEHRVGTFVQRILQAAELFVACFFDNRLARGERQLVFNQYRVQAIGAFCRRGYVQQRVEFRVIPDLDAEIRLGPQLVGQQTGNFRLGPRIAGDAPQNHQVRLHDHRPVFQSRQGIHPGQHAGGPAARQTRVLTGRDIGIRRAEQSATIADDGGLLRLVVQPSAQLHLTFRREGGDEFGGAGFGFARTIDLCCLGQDGGQDEEIGQGGREFGHDGVESRLIRAFAGDQRYVGIRQCQRTSAQIVQGSDPLGGGDRPAGRWDAKCDHAIRLARKTRRNGRIQNAGPGLFGIDGTSFKSGGTVWRHDKAQRERCDHRTRCPDVQRQIDIGWLIAGNRALQRDPLLVAVGNGRDDDTSRIDRDLGAGQLIQRGHREAKRLLPSGRNGIIRRLDHVGDLQRHRPSGARQQRGQQFRAAIRRDQPDDRDIGIVAQDFQRKTGCGHRAAGLHFHRVDDAARIDHGTRAGDGAKARRLVRGSSRQDQLQPVRIDFGPVQPGGVQCPGHHGARRRFNVTGSEPCPGDCTGCRQTECDGGCDCALG